MTAVWDSAAKAAVLAQEALALERAELGALAPEVPASWEALESGRAAALALEVLVAPGREWDPVAPLRLPAPVSTPRR